MTEEKVSVCMCVAMHVYVCSCECIDVLEKCTEMTEEKVRKFCSVCMCMCVCVRLCMCVCVHVYVLIYCKSVQRR